MDIINLIACSSLHIILHDPQTWLPVQFGSGCIVFYQNRYFLLSVAHVTDRDKYAVCIETNQPRTNEGTPMYCVGAMRYFDLYKVDPKQFHLIASAEKLFENFEKTLDITFCEIKEQIELIQPEWDFNAYKIDAGKKAYLNLEEAGLPEKGKRYGLCGRIKQSMAGTTLTSMPTLKLDLTYSSSTKEYLNFIVPEIIKDKNDYQGCSGAPILDEDGKLVGLAAEIMLGTKILRAFSIERCRELLDFSLTAGMI